MSSQMEIRDYFILTSLAACIPLSPVRDPNTEWVNAILRDFLKLFLSPFIISIKSYMSQLYYMDEANISNILISNTKS